MIKQSISYISMLIMLLMSPLSFAEHSAQINHTAPNFTLSDSDGNQISLSDFKDKIVVLEWTNHECPFVVKHYDSNNMQNLQKTYTEKGVVWLSIISSAKGKQGYVEGEEANRLTRQRGAAPTKVLLDPKGEVGRLYDAKTTPHMYIINKEGNLVYMGSIDSIRSTKTSDVERAENYVSLALEALMNDQPIKMSQTKPYGCSVKY